MEELKQQIINLCDCIWLLADTCEDLIKNNRPRFDVDLDCIHSCKQTVDSIQKEML